MDANEITHEEIVEIVIAIAERDGGCVCFTLWELPIIPSNPKGSFPLRPHPRCPMHKDLKL